MLHDQQVYKNHLNHIPKIHHNDNQVHNDHDNQDLNDHHYQDLNDHHDLISMTTTTIIIIDINMTIMKLLLYKS